MYLKHNRSGMVAVLGPFEALPCYIHTYILCIWLSVEGGREDGVGRVVRVELLQCIGKDLERG
jgi:hypothetical protein